MKCVNCEKNTEDDALYCRHCLFMGYDKPFKERPWPPKKECADYEEKLDAIYQTSHIFAQD